MSIATHVRTASDFIDAFDCEQGHVYPDIDAFEQKMGAMLDRQQMEATARVLACPVKQHPPCWQHGRIVYAATRKRLRDHLLTESNGSVLLLDVGTAKGYSALCMQWALKDSGAQGRVISLDVIDPNERIARNTIAEVNGLKTLHEILSPWRDAQSIAFTCMSGREWLVRHPFRVHVAFLDGKHAYEAVSAESTLLAQRQKTGDLIIFDDVQIPGVQRAVSEVKGYDVYYLKAHQDRAYAVARKL